jgi:hypothetical protein
MFQWFQTFQGLGGQFQIQPRKPARLRMGFNNWNDWNFLEPLELIFPVYIFICLIIAWVSGLLSSNNFSDMV